MTELIIDGTQAVLPKDFNCTVKRENPLFTKNGEYTYEITLDLTNPTNAELYKHLNRVNSVDEIEENRTLILIADNRVYCHGTEIITGWTDKQVTIQAASGNSELNYFIGSDKLISELELPDISPFKSDGTPDTKYASGRYPDVDICLPLVYDGNTETMINNWRYVYTTYAAGVREGGIQPAPGYTENDYQPQVFLCAYIREVMKAIGYTLSENQIADSKYKDAYIVQLNYTTAWNKMLPGWTVGEFLEEVEKLFNVTFIIEGRTKSVRLLFNNTYYLAASSCFVSNVIDEYEAERITENSNAQLHKSVNIAYQFPDTAYFRKRQIPTDFYKSLTKGVIPKSFAEENAAGSLGFSYIAKWFGTEAGKQYNVIFYDEKTGREYVKTDDLWSNMNINYYQLNEFKKIDREAEETMELNMMPAPMSIHKGHTYYGSNIVGYYAMMSIPTPENPGEVNEETETTTVDIIQSLDEGINNAASVTKSAIYLAFHQGFNNFAASNWPDNSFPLSFTDIYAPDVFDQKKTNSENITLRLADLEEELYSGVYEIDEDSPRTFVSYDPNVYDTRAIFVIRNKRWVCREIEYTLTADGRSGSWKGVFYPINISDTEADQRWVLTDGTWRDGGVWLDNGRWLDE